MLERIPPLERRDLLIAWLAISIAFTLIFIRNRVDPATALFFFVVSLLTVGVGFILHELAHKFSAMHFGYWAEFRKDNQMLLVAVVLAALVGVVFAAPGATVVFGDRISRREDGLISAAGPATSLVLAGLFAVLYLVDPGSVVGVIGRVGMQVNGMIAAFNMLPVSILDGRKVLAWNPVVFLVMIAAAFGMVYMTYVI
jgi:Zn-dependent protease